MELRYEEGGGPRDGGMSLGRRSRLIEAHRVAQEFYADALLDTAPEARAGRDFLRERGFDGKAAERFGVGFAPRGGEDADPAPARPRASPTTSWSPAGLSGRGSRGLYDRFRGRLVWPIRDITGDTVGFGARRALRRRPHRGEVPQHLRDPDLQEVARCSTASTPRRRPSPPSARRSSSRATPTSWPATSPASRAPSPRVAPPSAIDHIKMLRRIMRDEADLAPARVVFTFDGDAAGQKAAMRAFGEDQRWASQSFVAVADRRAWTPATCASPRATPPCAHLVEDAVPMFEFAVRTTIHRFDLDDRRGPGAGACGQPPRSSAQHPRPARCARSTPAPWPAGSGSRSSRCRPRWPGRPAWRPATPRTRAVDPRPGPRSPADTEACPSPSLEEVRASLPAPDLRDPVVFAERQLLQASCSSPPASSPATSTPSPRVLRRPGAPGHASTASAGPAASSEASPRGPGPPRSPRPRPLAVRGLVSELSVAPLPTRFDKATGQPERRYTDRPAGARAGGLPDPEDRRCHVCHAADGRRPPERPRAGARPERQPAEPPARAGQPARPGQLMGWSLRRRPPGEDPRRGPHRPQPGPGRAAAHLGARRHHRRHGRGEQPPPVCREPSRRASSCDRPWHLVDAGSWSARRLPAHRHLGRPPAAGPVGPQGGRPCCPRPCGSGCRPLSCWRITSTSGSGAGPGR